MNKILTIIIPTYNMEKYLDRCLSSLLVNDNSLLKSLEVLVINDGSKDSSSRIAHNYQKLYPDTFRIIDKENGNYGSCINVGLKEAQGKYIKVLDADDRFDTCIFEQYLKLLFSVDVDMIVSSGVNVNSVGDISYIWNFPYEHNQFYPIEKLHSVWIHEITYRTDILRKINYRQTEGISYSDEEWVFYPMFSIFTFYTLPLRLYQYTVGRDGQTMNLENWKKSIGNEILVSKGLLSYLNNREWNSLSISNYLYEKLKNRFSDFYQRALLQCVMFDDDDLKNFDLFLKDKCFDWYNITNNIIAPSNRWHFRYVEYWRSHNYQLCAYCNKILLFRIWSRIIAIIHNII